MTVIRRVKSRTSVLKKIEVPLNSKIKISRTHRELISKNSQRSGNQCKAQITTTPLLALICQLGIQCGKGVEAKRSLSRSRTKFVHESQPLQRTTLYSNFMWRKLKICKNSWSITKKMFELALDFEQEQRSIKLTCCNETFFSNLSLPTPNILTNRVIIA